MNRKVLSQGEKNNSELSEIFKNNVNSILIASGSFKAGFSVKGPALQAVIITALPFPVNKDPFIELKIKEYSKRLGITDTFEILFRLMLIDLEQSMGRLIRDVEDYGVIYIADNRIYTKNYKSRIINWFNKKGYRISNDLDNLSNFMKKSPEKISSNIIKSENNNKIKNLVLPKIIFDPSLHSTNLHRKFIIK